jgi:hypothetical protein
MNQPKNYEKHVNKDAKSSETLNSQSDPNKKYKYFKIFIVLFTLLNLLVFVAYVILTLKLIDLTVCDEKLFPNNDFKVRNNENQKIIHDLSTREAFIYDDDKSKVSQLIQQALLGVSLNYDNFKQIAIDKPSSKANYQVHFDSKSASIPNLTFSVSDGKASTQNINCKTYEWKSNRTLGGDQNYNQVFEDCFMIDKWHWYGQAESKLQQFWPINPYTTLNDSYIPYVTGLFEDGASIIERYWLSSAGLALIVDPNVPLFLKKNQTHLCFMSDELREPYTYTPQVRSSDSKLKYDLCKVRNRNDESSKRNFLNNLHLHVIQNYFALPSAKPDDLMFKYPIWSTWAKYKKNITNDTIIEFAQEIFDFVGHNVSQIEIDDKWEVDYGNFDFDRTKFPNFKEMIEKLRDEFEYRSTLWIHPFANIESLGSSQNFLYQALNFLEVRSTDGVHPGLTSWWNGMGSIILDTTNHKAQDYFLNRLLKIREETTIDSFKFDAGKFLLLYNFWRFIKFCDF